MNFYQVRQELGLGKSLLNLPLKVTFYARVSTDKDVQLNSLDNQVYYYKNYITSNPNWTYIEGYIDEGLSGTSTHKRKSFLKMIADSKNHFFDLVITKEISRFSRNLLDSIKYTEILKQNDVGVLFQTNNINTYDPNSEFILNMMSSLAQEEVKRLSTRVKWGHFNAIKRGRVLGNNSITGYVKDNAKLIIHPEEAKKIKQIFSLYATGKYGLNKLGLELYKRGIKNRNNHPYTKDTLKRIIENPKYKGYYRGHTTEVLDYKTKKRQIIAKEQQIIFKDKTIPAIVEEPLWDKANQLLIARSTSVKQRRSIPQKYPYTSKITCSKHHTFYQRLSNKYGQWACSKYVTYGNKVCPSPRLKEIDLNNIIISIINKLPINKEEILNELLALYKTFFTSSLETKTTFEVTKLKQQNLLDLYLESLITKEEYILKNKSLQEKLAKDKTEHNHYNLERLKDKLSNYLELNTYITLYIELFIKEIVVDFTSKTNINLKIYLTIPVISYSANYQNKKLNITYTVY